MHKSHLPSPDGMQCDRCNVIAAEAAAQVPCPYTGVWGPRDTTPVVRVHEWRGTCATPSCDVTMVLRSPMLSQRQDWPLEFSTPCVGCGRDLLVTSAGEVPRTRPAGDPDRSAVLGLAVAARLERKRNPSFRDFMLLAEIAWDGAQTRNPPNPKCPGYRRSDYGKEPTCKYCGQPENEHAESKV
jgi:hypothetical protein